VRCFQHFESTARLFIITATIIPETLCCASWIQASVGNTQQFTAQAYSSNGTITNGTALVTWGSTNPPTVTTISLGGIATSLSPGTTTITATAAGTSGASATLTVNQLLSITITPANLTIAAGASQQYDAMGTFSGATGTTDITSMVDSVNGWNSSNSAVATIGAGTGRATAATTGTGTAVISASLYGMTGNTNLTLGPPVPVSLQITPAAPTTAVGNSVSFLAQEVWSDDSIHIPSATGSSHPRNRCPHRDGGHSQIRLHRQRQRP
jgi:trimeric autotransporter adhesin